jgi:glycosyltransferase involved in cell wall biosynthesis
LDRIDPTGATAIVPNGLEGEEWQSPGPCPAWFAALSQPRLLYVGSLDNRVDITQITRLAAAFPNGSITLAGPMQRPDHYAPLQGLPQVVLPGPVGRSELTGLVAAADACLVPHVRNPMTEAMSPLKLYEYLAAGRPVAAVALPGTANVDARVQLADPGEDLAPAVARALALGPASEQERQRFIASHGWDRRFDRILALVLDGAK